jgi:hypothetical protein
MVHDGQIRSGQCRAKISVGGAPGHPVVLGQLVPADAELAGALEIRITRIAGFARRLQEHVHRPAHRAAVADMLWAADPVVLIAAAFVVFGAVWTYFHSKRSKGSPPNNDRINNCDGIGRTFPPSLLA